MEKVGKNLLLKETIVVVGIFLAFAFIARPSYAGWTDRNAAAGAGTINIKGTGVSSDGQTIIIVGDSGLIKTSADGGTTWTDRNAAAGVGITNLTAVDIGPSGQMIAVGDSGIVITSTNGGAGWTNRSSAAGAGTGSLRAVSIGASGVILLVGDGGYIRTSTDGGATWVDRNSACGCATLYMLGAAVSPTSGSNMLAVATDYMFTSTDGGASWTNRTGVAGVSPSDLYSAAIGPNGTTYISGGTGPTYLRTSTDNGASWTDRISASGLSTQNVRAVAIGPGGVMYAGATAGFLKTSSDGGASWSDLSSASGIGASDVRDIAIDSSGNFIVVGTSGYVRTYTGNSAPTITSGPSAIHTVDYASGTRTGPNNRWQFLMTATDAEQTGSNQLTYYIHTGANRTGTLINSSTFTSGVQVGMTLTYNQSGLSQGANTLYVSVYDGTNYSVSNPSFTVYRDDVAPSSSSSISTNPATVTGTYTVTFTPSDAISTNGNEIVYQIRTATGGLGTLLTSGTSTSGSPKTTGSITDAGLVLGANTRYVRTCDGANNCTDTSFTVTFDPRPAVTTSAASSIAATTAILNSTVNPNGLSTNVSYLWGTSTTGTTSSDCALLPNTLVGPLGLTGTGNLSGATTQTTLPSLSANQTYYFCVMATNSSGTNYGSVLSFTTSPTVGAYQFMDAGSALGGGTTDCQDNPNGVPCPPANVSASSSVYNQTTVTWNGTQNGGTVPAVTNGYDILWCDRTAVPGCTPSTLIPNQVSPYTHSGRTQTTTYAYAIQSKNAAGNSVSSSVATVLTPSNCTYPTVYSDNDHDTYGNSSTITQGLVTTANVDTVTSITINKPADIVNGMFMIMALGWTSGTNRSISTINGVAAPAGWTLINRTDNGVGYSTAVYYKIASGESPSYNIVLSGSANDISGFITSFGNVNTSNPINANSGGTSTTSSYGASLTTTSANTLVVSVYASQLGGGFFSTPTGMTPVTNTTGTSSFDNIAAFRVQQVSSGSSGNKLATLYNGSNGAATSSTGSIVIFALNNGQQTSNSICVQNGVSTDNNWSTNAGDCDDLTSSYYQNLSGYADMDGDGQVSASSYLLCSGPALRTGASVSPGTDCNDSNAAYTTTLTGYTDEDSDGYTVGGPVSVCSGGSLPTGYRASASTPVDCYDKNSAAYPNSTIYNNFQRGDTSATKNVQPIAGNYVTISNAHPAINGGGTDAGGNSGASYDYDCSNGTVTAEDRTGGYQDCVGNYMYTYNSCGDPTGQASQCIMTQADSSTTYDFVGYCGQLSGGSTSPNLHCGEAKFNRLNYAPQSASITNYTSCTAGTWYCIPPDYMACFLPCSGSSTGGSYYLGYAVECK